MQGRLYTNPFLDQKYPTECLGYDINSSQVKRFLVLSKPSSFNYVEVLYPLTKEQWAAGTDDFTCEPITEFAIAFNYGQTKLWQFGLWCQKVGYTDNLFSYSVIQ